MSGFDREKLDVESYEKRLREITRLTDDFIKFYREECGDTLVTISDAPRHITNFYFRVLLDEVKPLVPTKVNRYKIATVTDLCIVDLQPIRSDDPLLRRKINAQFALYAMISFVGSFPKTFEIKDCADEELKRQGLIMLKQYYQWLLSKKPKSYPIFATGAFLRTLHLVLYNNWPNIVRENPKGT